MRAGGDKGALNKEGHRLSFVLARRCSSQSKERSAPANSRPSGNFQSKMDVSQTHHSKLCSNFRNWKV